MAVWWEWEREHSTLAPGCMHACMWVGPCADRASCVVPKTCGAEATDEYGMQVTGQFFFSTLHGHGCYAQAVLSSLFSTVCRKNWITGALTAGRGLAGSSSPIGQVASGLGWVLQGVLGAWSVEQRRCSASTRGVDAVAAQRGRPTAAGLGRAWPRQDAGMQGPAAAGRPRREGLQTRHWMQAAAAAAGWASHRLGWASRCCWSGGWPAMAARA